MIKRALQNLYHLEEQETNVELARKLLAIVKLEVTRELAINQFAHCKIDTQGL